MAEELTPEELRKIADQQACGGTWVLSESMEALRAGADAMEARGRVQRLWAKEIARRAEVARQLADALEARNDLRAEIDAAWQYIEHGYDIESRAELEAQAKTNGFRYGLAQAMHHIQKRRVKENFPPTEVATLWATLAAVREKLAWQVHGNDKCTCDRHERRA